MFKKSISEQGNAIPYVYELHVNSTSLLYTSEGGADIVVESQCLHRMETPLENITLAFFFRIHTKVCSMVL